MTRDELFQVLNKGIPSFVFVELNTDTIIRECASDRASLISSIHRIKQAYEEKVMEIMGFSKYKYCFFRDFRIMTSYKNSETSLHISPNSFLIKLKEILGITNPSLDFNDMDLKAEMLRKLGMLKSEGNPEELKEDFPLIHDDYISAINIADRLNACRLNPSLKDKMTYQWRMYNAYGFDKRFFYFLSRQSLMYRNFIIRRQFIEGYCHRNELDLGQFEGLDKEKFNFYVAYRYLETAKKVRSVDKMQECVYYLMAYFREEKNLRLSIIGDNAEKVTYRKLLGEFKRLLSVYRDLKPIDEDRSKFTGYHYKHVENHINKYYGNVVNWFIIPASSTFDFLSVAANEGEQRNVLSLEEKNERLKKRMALYNKKIQLYEKTGYVLKIFGWNDFNGYVCYVYPNGKIIMDKLFEDYIRCIPAKDEAIYTIEASDFETLSKLSKQDLIKSGKAKRFYHAGSWESRILNIVSSLGNEKSIEAVKTLEKIRKA